MKNRKADREAVGRCEIKIFAPDIRVEICATEGVGNRIADRIADAVCEIIDQEDPEGYEHNSVWSKRTEDQP